MNPKAGHGENEITTDLFPTSSESGFASGFNLFLGLEVGAEQHMATVELGSRHMLNSPWDSADNEDLFFQHPAYGRAPFPLGRARSPYPRPKAP